MTIEQIKEMVAGNQYDFLRTNPHLAGKIIFLTLGGSHAYGTNVETSDVDVRGCALNSRSDLLGLSAFEQVVNTETDTTIYSFNKLISLLINCNPNTIELLGCKPEHYFVLTDIGKQMIDNVHKKHAHFMISIWASFGPMTQQFRELNEKGLLLPIETWPHRKKWKIRIKNLGEFLQCLKKELLFVLM